MRRGQTPCWNWWKSPADSTHKLTEQESVSWRQSPTSSGSFVCGHHDQCLLDIISRSFFVGNKTFRPSRKGGTQQESGWSRTNTNKPVSQAANTPLFAVRIDLLKGHMYKIWVTCHQNHVRNTAYLRFRCWICTSFVSLENRTLRSIEKCTTFHTHIWILRHICRIFQTKVWVFGTCTSQTFWKPLLPYDSLLQGAASPGVPGENPGESTSFWGPSWNTSLDLFGQKFQDIDVLWRQIFFHPHLMLDFSMRYWCQGLELDSSFRRDMLIESCHSHGLRLPCVTLLECRQNFQWSQHTSTNSCFTLLYKSSRLKIYQLPSHTNFISHLFRYKLFLSKYLLTFVPTQYFRSISGCRWASVCDRNCLSLNGTHEHCLWACFLWKSAWLTDPCSFGMCSCLLCHQLQLCKNHCFQSKQKAISLVFWTCSLCSKLQLGGIHRVRGPQQNLPRLSVQKEKTFGLFQKSFRCGRFPQHRLSASAMGMVSRRNYGPSLSVCLWTQTSKTLQVSFVSLSALWSPQRLFWPPLECRGSLTAPLFVVTTWLQPPQMKTWKVSLLCVKNLFFLPECREFCVSLWHRNTEPSPALCSAVNSILFLRNAEKHSTQHWSAEKE